jgi:hypothetical protein
MKNIILAAIASACSALFGSVILAILFKRIDLFRSIFIIALPVCVIVGLSAFRPWSSVARRHGYGFATLGGVVVGGLVGAVIIAMTYYLSPVGHLSKELFKALVIWIFIGGLFGVIYSVLLKVLMSAK